MRQRWTLRHAPVLIAVVLLMAALLAVTTTWPVAATDRHQPGRLPASGAPIEGGLNAVAAASPSDVWAVGYRGETDTRPFAEHWDGQRWAATPTVGRGEFFDVAVPGGTQAWAVGISYPASGTLVERWRDGAWERVPSPSPGSEGAQLLAIDGTSASDIWAVGLYSTGSVASLPLVEHWDGKRWRVVPVPRPAGSPQSALKDVVVVAPDNVWAVGFGYGSDCSCWFTLVEHWDGQAWKRVPSPSPGRIPGLDGVSAVSATDITAVGSLQSRPLAEHWDGTRWSVRTTPNPPSPDGSWLKGIDVLTATDAWAVGGTGVASLVTRWDGTRWRRTPSPNVGTLGTGLTDVVSVSASDAWAVGYYQISLGESRPLIEHWDGSQWTVAQRIIGGPCAPASCPTESPTPTTPPTTAPTAEPSSPTSPTSSPTTTATTTTMASSSAPPSVPSPEPSTTPIPTNLPTRVPAGLSG